MTSPSPTALPALPDHVVKLIPADQWPALCGAQTIAYSALDTTDGFMHLSTPEQIVGTANRHYTEYPFVIGLVIPTRHIMDSLKWEPAAKRNHALFPHLYAQCPTAWISHALVLRRSTDKTFMVAAQIDPPFDPATDFSLF